MHGVQQPPPPRQQPIPAVQSPSQPEEPEVFDDDEVELPSGEDNQRQAAASSGTLAVKTHVEFSAVARDSSHNNFAVLVHVKAPAYEAAAGDRDAPRAPLDLVTVLDVSGSMHRNKLALVKQAMGFVIGSLGPHDRLSVVSFSSGARRVTRLLRMSDTGKSLATEAVEALRAGGTTNIAEGLRTAAKVLAERRHRNTVRLQRHSPLRRTGQPKHAEAGAGQCAQLRGAGATVLRAWHCQHRRIVCAHPHLWFRQRP
jgi:Mg-chelatase subunit ChlD